VEVLADAGTNIGKGSHARHDCIAPALAPSPS
jgi:hypothetical protein